MNTCLLKAPLCHRLLTVGQHPFRSRISNLFHFLWFAENEQRLVLYLIQFTTLLFCIIKMSVMDQGTGRKKADKIFKGKNKFYSVLGRIGIRQKFNIKW